MIYDGSSDKSGEICDNYSNIDNRIKVFHKKNGGVSSARKVGVENCMVIMLVWLIVMII